MIPFDIETNSNINPNVIEPNHKCVTKSAPCMFLLAEKGHMKITGDLNGYDSQFLQKEKQHTGRAMTMYLTNSSQGFEVMDNKV